jgi:mannosylglucosylglycerate synthase
LNIGFVSTRLAGTDGVSLETAKLVTIMSRMGHACFYCAGELSNLGPAGTVVPEMRFDHPIIRPLQEAAFGSHQANDLPSKIAEVAISIEDQIRAFVREYSIDILIPENALTIPMNLPLGVALTDYISKTGIPTIAHHHDFWWERKRFAIHSIPEILTKYFPPNLPSIQHVVINSLAQKALAQRFHLESVVLPNVLDFERAPTNRHGRGDALRCLLKLEPNDRLILQPTRVVPRKGIEHSIELVRRIQETDPSRHHSLLVTHHAGDEGGEYLEFLTLEAARANVELQYLADWFPNLEMQEACAIDSWTLQDAYAASDLVSYPSLVEGFGNAFLEAVFYRRPILINRYPVYSADIAPHGFQVIEIDGAVSDQAVTQVQTWLNDENSLRGITDHNYEVARQHFSYRTAEQILSKVLASLR